MIEEAKNAIDRHTKNKLSKGYQKKEFEARSPQVKIPQSTDSDGENIFDEILSNLSKSAKNSSKVDKSEDNPKRERIFGDGGEDSISEALDEPSQKEDPLKRKRRKPIRFDDEYSNTDKTKNKKSPVNSKLLVEEGEKQSPGKGKVEKQIIKVPVEPQKEQDPLVEVLEYLSKEGQHLKGAYLVLEDPEAAQFFKIQILKNRLKIEEGAVNSLEEVPKDYRSYSNANEAIAKANEEILFRAEAGYHLKTDNFIFTFTELESQAETNVKKREVRFMPEEISEEDAQVPTKVLTRTQTAAERFKNRNQIPIKTRAQALQRFQKKKETKLASYPFTIQKTDMNNYFYNHDANANNTIEAPNNYRSSIFSKKIELPYARANTASLFQNNQINNLNSSIFRNIAPQTNNFPLRNNYLGQVNQVDTLARPQMFPNYSSTNYGNQLIHGLYSPVLNAQNNLQGINEPKEDLKFFPFSMEPKVSNNHLLNNILNLTKTQANTNPVIQPKSPIEGQTAEDKPGKPSEEKMCIVCMDKLADIAFIPCGHKITCFDCSQKIMSDKRVCPICSQNIISALRIYES